MCWQADAPSPALCLIHILFINSSTLSLRSTPYLSLRARPPKARAPLPLASLEQRLPLSLTATPPLSRSVTPALSLPHSQVHTRKRVEQGTLTCGTSTHGELPDKKLPDKELPDKELPDKLADSQALTSSKRPSLYLIHTFTSSTRTSCSSASDLI